MTKFVDGDVSGQQVLTDDDHLYPDHINELRQSRGVSAVVGRTPNCEYYCDGVDDQVQIQQALDDLTPGRTWKEKVVLVGDFHLSSGLIIPSFTTLEIQGSLINEGSPNAMIDCNDYTTDIEIFGGILIGNYDGVMITPGLNLTTEGLERFNIHDITIKDFDSNGVHIKGVTDLIFSNIIVDNCGQTTSLSHNIYMIRIYNGIINNVITRNANNCGLKLRGCRNISVNNLVSRENGRGIQMAGGDSEGTPMYNVTVSNSVFSNNSVYGGEIYTEEGAIRDIRISSSIFIENGEHGLYLRSLNLDSLTVSGCSFWNNSQETANTYSGIYINNGRWIKIQGNQFGDIHLTTTDRYQKDGLEVVGGSSFFPIQNNDFRRNRGYGINTNKGLFIQANSFGENGVGAINDSSGASVIQNNSGV